MEAEAEVADKQKSVSKNKPKKKVDDIFLFEAISPLVFFDFTFNIKSQIVFCVYFLFK